METEGVTLEFEDAATRAIAKVAEEANRLLENIGERLSVAGSRVASRFCSLSAVRVPTRPYHSITVVAHTGQ